MDRIKLAILIIMLVFIAAPVAQADSWNPWYMVSSSLPDPVNPPGGAGWTAWSSNPVVVPDQNYLWIGAENIPRPNYMKIGELRFTYSFENFAYPDYGGPGGNEAAGGGTFTYWHGYTVSQGPPLWLETEVVDFHIVPQPSWEWFRFQNIPEPGLPGGNLTIIAMSIDTSCVPIPLPGAVWLLGSGLVGLVGWMRLKKG
jgi:hypothetical protein